MVKSLIRPSAQKVNTTANHKRVGERHVLQCSTRKYSMHHAGFIALVLHDFCAKVYGTDKCGRILVPQQMSQKAFVNRWIRCQQKLSDLCVKLLIITVSLSGPSARQGRAAYHPIWRWKRISSTSWLNSACKVSRLHVTCCTLMVCQPLRPARRCTKI